MVKIRGKGDLRLIIATLYRPVQAEGAMTAYQQHKSILLQNGCTDCPRANLFLVLKEQIIQWKQDGYQIIVAGDFNEDVRSNNVKNFFAQLSMEELIIKQHGTNIPNTYINGSTPIDGIFATIGIIPQFSGYTPFTWGMYSDHRLLWVDLDMTLILGSNAPPLWKPQARRMKCENPQTIQAFNNVSLKHMTDNNIQLRMQEIEDMIVNKVSQREWGKKVEELDKIRVEGIIIADKKCRKLKMGNVQWSPEMKKLMLRIDYIQRCRLRYVMKRASNSRTLMKWFRKTDLTTPITNAAQTIEALKNEFQNYREQKKQADAKRQSFLEQLAETKADEGNFRKEKILRQLIQLEHQRSMFRKIKVALGKMRQGVTTIEAPDADGNWVLYINMDDIEKGCIEENKRRFTQASQTPPLQDKQIEILGWTANTATSQEILQTGTTDNQDLHPLIRNMIKYYKSPETIQHFTKKQTIPIEQYTHMWRRSREYTSTGVSTLHFGHFKASINDPQLANFDLWFLNLTLSTGYNLSRWQKAIDVMIPKKTNSLRVDKLRTIVLMEPDFNFFNKIIGKWVMANAEGAGSIATEQFGSRKSKSSIQHAINKQIATDTLRQDKKNFCLIMLDAKACYDRIVQPIASIALKRQGASHQMVKAMFRTISKMKRCIRTSFGDSQVFYSEGQSTFHGILQGNGAGPAIWVMMSTPMLDRLKSEGYGIKIELPDGSTLVIPAFAFVDDVDLIQELRDDEPTITQKMVRCWEESLTSTGGALVPEKCRYSVVKYEWQQNECRTIPTIDKDIQISIKGDDGSEQVIKQISNEAGELALGLKFSPTNNNKDEMEYLLDKATIWAENVRTGHLKRQEAWTCLEKTIMNTINYAMPATTLSKTQLEMIMKPILDAGLSRAGICRKMARTVVYAQRKYLGLGIKHPYITQGIRKIEALFNQSQTTTLSLIEATWLRMQNECGIGPHFLEESNTKFHQLATTGWLRSLWEFASTYDIKIRRITNGTERSFRNEKDSYIIQEVCRANKWGIKDLLKFNCCRLYLRVEMTSDILTADGKKIKHAAWNGLIDKGHTNFIPSYFEQPKPGPSAWSIWRSILRST
jgi:Reverse transcriptase (RNA-dependent DNA polymerase)